MSAASPDDRHYVFVQQWGPATVEIKVGARGFGEHEVIELSPGQARHFAQELIEAADECVARVARDSAARKAAAERREAEAEARWQAIERGEQ